MRRKNPKRSKRNANTGTGETKRGISFVTAQWHPDDFSNFTQPKATFWRSRMSQGMEGELASESAESQRIVPDEDDFDEQYNGGKFGAPSTPGFASVGEAFRALAMITAKQSNYRQNSRVVSVRNTLKPNNDMNPMMARRSTFIDISALKQGISHAMRSDMTTDADALHTAVDIMVQKFGQAPGIYDKWRKWFRPVCDPDHRMQAISKRFEVEYRVNINEYEPSLQPRVKVLRRNIRQLIHKEYAPINNREWHEKLGDLLIQKSRADMKNHLKQLEERERQKQAKRIQMGVVKAAGGALTPSHPKGATSVKSATPRTDNSRGSKVTEVAQFRAREKAMEDMPTAMKVLTLFDKNQESNLAAVNLDVLKSTVRKRIVDYEKLQSAAQIALTSLTSTPSPKTISAWKSSLYSRRPLKERIITAVPACTRGVELLDAPGTKTENDDTLSGTQWNPRWSTWSFADDLPSDDTAALVSEDDSPSVTELYTRAGRIMKDSCIWKKDEKVDTSEGRSSKNKLAKTRNGESLPTPPPPLPPLHHENSSYIHDDKYDGELTETYELPDDHSDS